MLKAFIFLGFGLAVAASAVPSAIFTSTSSKLVKPNSIYSVYITLEPTAPVAHYFTLSINSSETDGVPGVLYTSPEVSISPGESGKVEITTKDLPAHAYNLTLRGYPVDSTEEDGFMESSTVYKSIKHHSLLLQTDKVIYKPGEMVNYRVVMFCPKLRPLSNQLVNISVLDPQRNVIKFLPNEEVNNGIFSSNFHLSSEPNLGDWKIKVNTEDQTTQHEFTVAKYVLPKFKVELNLPNFVTYNSSKFTAEVKAAYTYGKPIVGKFEVRLSEYRRYQWGEPAKTVLKTGSIDGSQSVEFDIAGELEQKPMKHMKEFQVTATVTDELTGKTQNISKIIKVHEYPYKIQMIESPRNYKPGFPLELKFKVTTQDDIPISDSNEKALKIEHGFVCEAENAVDYFPIPSNGIVNWTIVTPTNELYSANSIKVTYKDYTFTGYPPRKLMTPSKVYMAVTLDTKSPGVNSKLNVKVMMNHEFEALNYLLFGRGKIRDSGRMVVSPTRKESTFEVLVPKEVAPEGKLIVYTVVKDTNEIVAESVKFQLTTELENDLKISLSKDTGQPGEKVKIYFDTMMDSLVALRGVDQSVLLLKEDKDITLETIEKEIKSYEDEIGRNKHWGGSQSFQAFEEAGVIIMTNGVLDVPKRYFPHNSASVEESQYFQSFESDSFARPPLQSQTNRVHGTMAVSHSTPLSLSQDVRVRTEFPETWLWEEVHANESRSVLEKTIPDTITSWFISGFSLNPDSGVGVSNGPTVLRTFRPFFLSLNVPYSVVRGEIFGLQVLVHNYMDMEVTADITLQNSGNGFEFQEESNKAAPKSTKAVTVGPNQVNSVIFIVKIVKFGMQSLDIKAVTTNEGNTQAGDAISKMLIVKPPGQRQSITRSILVDLRSTPNSKDTLSVELPTNRVEGADAVRLTVISDLLGSTISNLDKLLKMPTGCGEQNMVHFVPDIVILQYLESSGTLTPQIKSKALRFLEAGYQRQLTYRRSDGSFSAFGKYDRHGSTWLTAFVVRSFVAAKPYITIDDDVITDALKFLVSKQQSDGSFLEHGTVLQNELKGGALEGLALTAYITLAMVEITPILDNTEEVQNATFAKDLALEYISNTPLKDLDDPYAAAIVTYTLQIANHGKAEAFKQVLEKLAKQEGGLKFWEPRKVEVPVNDTTPRPWVPRIKPVSVEMTSYALLVYLAQGKLEDALPVGKWLIQQRTEDGGFISTQDTVVGLTALAKFAMSTFSDSPDLSINVAYEGGSNDLIVNKKNQIVLQEVTLPNTIRSVELSAEGKGSALAQFTCSYYVEDKEDVPAFKIDIDVSQVIFTVLLRVILNIH